MFSQVWCSRLAGGVHGRFANAGPTEQLGPGPLRENSWGRVRRQRGVPGRDRDREGELTGQPLRKQPGCSQGAEFDFSGGEDYDRVPPGPVTWTPANSNMAVTSALSPGRHLVAAWLTEDGTNKVVAATHLVVTAPIFVWDPDNSAC